MTSPDAGPGAGPSVPVDALRAAARRFGTPVAVTSVAALAEAAAELEAAFPDPWLRAFSLKANDVPAIVARLGALGFDANVVSRGEWAIARRAGIPNARITLEGIGQVHRRPPRGRGAAAADGDPLRWVAEESPGGARGAGRDRGHAGLGRGGRPALDVLIRLNPDVSPETLAGLAVGHGASKFGMTASELTTTVSEMPAEGLLAIRGVHLHVGSQLGAVDAWRDAVRRGLALLALLGAGRPGMDTFDVGGGFPVGDPGSVPTPARSAREAAAALEAILAERRERGGWPPSPAGSWSRGPGGWWRRCCTCESGRGRRGSW